MRDEGIEQVVVLPFDRKFASLTPEEFVREDPGRTVGAAAVSSSATTSDSARSQAGDVRPAETAR